MTEQYTYIPLAQYTGEALFPGKPDYRALKLQSLAVAAQMSGLGKRQVRMFECGSYLEFLELPNGERLLIKVFYCKDRMCPACQKRRSLVIFHEVRDICLSILTAKPTTRFLFVTLTVPNVKANDLSDTISHLCSSFSALMRDRTVRKATQGFFRAIEVTHNKSVNTYHPHIHALIAVGPNYFRRKYIKQSDWLRLWCRATGNDSITQVDVRAVKPAKGGDESVCDVVSEVAKYTVKPSSYLRMVDTPESYVGNREVIQCLALALRSKRLVGYGGLFKEHRALIKELALEKNEQDERDLELKLYGPHLVAITRRMYHWNIGLCEYVC